MVQSQTQANAQNSKYTIVLTEQELRFLLDCMAEKIARHVFTILSIRELNGYMPLENTLRNTYRELVRIMACVDLAEQILAAYIQAERDARIFDGADEDELFREAAESLYGLEAAPLMIEAPETDAITMWQRAGSWTGAMMLAGFEPLTVRSGLNTAIMRYSSSHASVEFLSSKTRALLPPNCIDLLRTFCDNAKAELRYTNTAETAQFKKIIAPYIRKSNIERKYVLRQLGLCEPRGLETYDKIIKEVKKQERNSQSSISNGAKKPDVQASPTIQAEDASDAKMRAEINLKLKYNVLQKLSPECFSHLCVIYRGAKHTKKHKVPIGTVCELEPLVKACGVEMKAVLLGLGLQREYDTWLNEARRRENILKKQNGTQNAPKAAETKKSKASLSPSVQQKRKEKQEISSFISSEFKRKHW
jgi:hypothetical protein